MIESSESGIPVEALKLSNMHFDASSGAMLFQVLGRMPELNDRLSSLKLEISLCNSPEQFECYVRFLRGNRSLTNLDLSGCDLGIRNCNSLLKALRNKPALTSLFLAELPAPERLGVRADSDLARGRHARSSRVGSLDAGWRIADPTRAHLAKLLERNREIFTTSAMKSGMRAWALGCAKLSFPNELAMHIFEQGLTRRDALNLASVNRKAWGLRQQLFRTIDSSK